MARINEAPTEATRAKSAPARLALSTSAILSGRRWRHTARWVGMAIFVLGVFMLGYVFWSALKGFQGFSSPDYFSRQLETVAGAIWQDKLVKIVQIAAAEFLRVLYLLLLGYLAAAIATKGIQFFSASEAVIDEAVTAGIEE